jgi:hypothetical protein
MRRWRSVPLAIAAALFVFLLLRPVYISRLRARESARSPETWKRLTTNGSFNLLVPALVGTRYHDESLYAARVREVLLHGLPTNPYWPEDRGLGSWIHDCVSIFILSGFALLCGGNLTWAWAVAVAAVGAVWFLWFHALFHRWSGRDDVAVPLALFCILFPDFSRWLLDVNFNVSINLDRYAAVFFQVQSGIRPLFYRLPADFLSSLLLAGLFTLTWRMIGRQEKRVWPAALLGAAYGLLILVHAFTFAFGAATLAALAVVVWGFDFPAASRRAAAIALVSAGAVTACYLLLMTGTEDAQTRRDSLELVGLVKTHHFYLITLVHVLMAAFGARQLSRETDPERRAVWLVLIAAQGGAFLCRNAQVVLGVMMQPFHFIPLGSFFGSLMLFMWLAKTLSERRWWNRRAGMAAALTIAGWALLNEKASAEKTYRLFGLPKNEEAGLQWVRANAAKDALVLTLSMQTNENVPLYTQAKVMSAPIGLNVSGPFSKEKYYFKIAQLLKTSRADADRFLAERWVTPGEHEALRGRLYREEFTLQKADTDAFEAAEWFYPFMYGIDADAPSAEGRARIRALVAELPPLDGPYYLWVNARDEHLLREPPAAGGGRLVFENETVKIYSFPPAAARL